MSIPFRDAPFPTTGGTADRTLDERFSDVINVAEFASLHEGSGSFGSGDGNDSPCFQAAFDLAFGSVASPHGETNKHLNRPVFIPSGNFFCEDPLYLKQIVGGHIYGAGIQSAHLRWAGGAVEDTSFLNIDGAANLCIERLKMTMFGDSTGENSAINLDWTNSDTGSGSDGLHNNLFSAIHIGTTGHFGIIIADSGYEGHSNMFFSVNINGSGTDPAHTVGVDVRGPAALNQSFIMGGGINCLILARCPVGGGSLHHQGYSTNNGAGGLDYLMESGHIMYLSQGRSETEGGLARLESGTLIVHAAQTTGAEFALEINGGKCLLEGSQLGNGNPVVGKIHGTGGELLLAGNLFNNSAVPWPLDGFLGDVLWDPEGVVEP